MTQIKEQIYFPPAVISGATSYVMGLKRAAVSAGFSVNTVINSTAKTALAAVAGTGAIQTTLTYTAVVDAAGDNGAAGNNITVALNPGGTAGSEVVTVAGQAIAVKIQSGVSTFTQVRTAMQAAAACTNLITTSGTSASTMTSTSTAAAHTYQTNLVVTAIVGVLGNGTAGNAITVAFTPGAVAGSEVVSVVGNAISVQVATGVSTVTQVRTALNASALSNVLIVASGTNASTIVTASAVALSGGADGAGTVTGGANSKFDIVNSAITSTAHGFFTGLAVQATKSGAAFPTGIAATTTYYVFKNSADVFQLFDTLAHALAASAGAMYSTSTGLIAITADASLSSTITFTPVSVSGLTCTLNWSNDYSLNSAGKVLNAGTWNTFASTETLALLTNSISSTGTTAISTNNPGPYSWVKAVFAISAGVAQVEVYGNSI